MASVVVPMREIEVKAKVRGVAKLLAAAKELGIVFGDVIEQFDTTYESALPHDDPEWNIFRIRQQGTAAILTMKHKASGRSRDNYEYESIVGSSQDIAKMLERLHYTKGVSLRKRRRVAHYNGLEICFDDIDELGTFVEVEKLADDNADVDAVQDELWSLLRSLGIHGDDRVHKGYDTLMHEHLSSKKPTPVA